MMEMEVLIVLFMSDYDFNWKFDVILDLFSFCFGFGTSLVSLIYGQRTPGPGFDKEASGSN